MLISNATNTNHHEGVVPNTLALPNRTLEPGQTLYEAGREASATSTSSPPAS
jgi:hypothetical protein